MREIYFQCDNCKTRVFNEFPVGWMHMPVFTVQVGKGCYTERAGDSYERGYASDERYKHYSQLTFCSMVCFLEWFKNTYPEYQNPSQRGL
jgi:hypothetical protein